MQIPVALNRHLGNTGSEKSSLGIRQKMDLKLTQLPKTYFWKAIDTKITEKWRNLKYRISSDNCLTILNRNADFADEY